MLAGALAELARIEWEQKRHGKQLDHFQSLERSWQIEKREEYRTTEKKEGGSSSPSTLYVKLIPYGYPGD